VAASLALAWASAGAAQPAPTAPGKVISDAVEYNAYMSALNTADPVAKAAAMGAFADKYPHSVVQADALDQELAAYQQAGDAAKVEVVARRILQAQPGAVRARAIVASLTRSRAAAATDAQSSGTLADQAGADAERGLADLKAWPKPDGMADADFAVVRDQMTSIFNGALGFSSLQHKDYLAARPFYLAALKARPDELGDAYQLAIADLQAKPVDPAGLWWAARAYDLAGAAKNTAAQASIAAFAKASYRRYHGGDDGWDQLVAAAASGAAPPTGFTVSPAPTPGQIAVKAVAENDPATLSFSDWEFVLALRDASAENHRAADKVWAAIQSLQAKALLKLTVKVIAPTADGFDAAMADDSQKADRVDVRVILIAPGASRPAPGAMVSVIGVLTGYTPDPFRFTLAEKPAPAP
jgi:tetratricopeptide (TPR) repeat protein